MWILNILSQASLTTLMWGVSKFFISKSKIQHFKFKNNSRIFLLYSSHHMIKMESLFSQ